MAKSDAGKRYPTQFRLKVAKAATAGSVVDVAKKYKVSEPSVYSWRNTLRDHGEAGFTGKQKQKTVGVAPRVTVTNSTHLKKRIGVAISDVLGDAVVNLRSQFTAERKRRVAAERSLRIIQNQLQKILLTTKGVTNDVRQAKR